MSEADVDAHIAKWGHPPGFYSIHEYGTAMGGPRSVDEIGCMAFYNGQPLKYPEDYDRPDSEKVMLRVTSLEEARYMALVGP